MAVRNGSGNTRASRTVRSVEGEGASALSPVGGASHGSRHDAGMKHAVQMRAVVVLSSKCTRVEEVERRQLDGGWKRKLTADRRTDESTQKCRSNDNCQRDVRG